MKIIVNADDFGASERINNAIVDAFKKGIVTNTTIMPNMSAYDEAVELAKENGFFDKVGIHLNLLAGEPLTLSIKQEPLLYDSETNRLTSKYILNKKNIFLRFFLPSHTKKALKKEKKKVFILTSEKSQLLLVITVFEHILNFFLAVFYKW